MFALIKNSLFITLILFFTTCKKSPENQISERLDELSDVLSFDNGGRPGVKTILETKNFANFFIDKPQMVVQIRGSKFQIRNNKSLQDHYLLMKKLIKSLAVTFNSKEFSQEEDAYHVDLTINAFGKDTQSKIINESIDYRYTFKKIDDQWIITHGQNIFPDDE